MTFSPARYSQMTYRRCGRSGIDLPAISLGLWQNFGDNVPFDRIRGICRRAFDLGVTHFDLANNYGPPPGSAELNFGRVLREDFAAHRDEIIISSKAGYRMWDGPYGEWGSRKSMMASLDQTLKRLGVDYVDIFYSHRADPHTPLEETMSALDQAVRQGKALYAGLSSYSAARTAGAISLLRERGTECLIHQPSYSMFNRWIEEDRLLDQLERNGVGCIVFSPLAQGLLTDKYLRQVPNDSRAAENGSFKTNVLSEVIRERLLGLDAIARKRGQTLAQLAIAWVLRDPRVTTALIGVSRIEQLEDCVAVLKTLEITQEELMEIELYAIDAGINLWATSSAVPAK